MRATGTARRSAPSRRTIPSRTRLPHSKMRAVELTSVALFLLLAVLSLTNLSVEGYLLPAAALLGWMLADLFSGVVHWALDSFGSVRTPVFGPAFIRPFRAPRRSGRHDAAR